MRTDEPALRAELSDDLDAASYAPFSSKFTTFGSALLTLAFIIAAAVGDAVNFESALGVVMEDVSSYLLISAVIALTSAAVGLMHFAGKSHKSFRSGMGRRGSAITLTCIWFLLGVGLLLLRVVGYKWYLSLSTSDAFGTAVAAPTNRWPEFAHDALALLFFFLYLATGAMASWAAYRAHEPVQDAARRAAQLRGHAAERAAKQQRLEQRREAEQQRSEEEREAEQQQRKEDREAEQQHREHEREAEQHRLEQEREEQRRLDEERAAHQRRVDADRAAEARRQAEEAVHQLELELIELEAQLAREENEVSRDPERRDAASRAIDAWSDELREYTRHRMSAVVGTPWGTSALTCADEDQ